MLPAQCTTKVDFESNRLAQKAWRELCKGSQGAEIAVQEFMEQHPGILPECFRDDDDLDPMEQKWRRRRGIELVYGKPSKGARLGGVVGRLRVQADEPLEHRVIHFRDIEAPDEYWKAKGIDIELIKSLRYCPISQFSVQQVEDIKRVVERILPPLCFYVIERSTENHIHFLCKQGATALGRRVRVVPDSNLVTVAGYVAKRSLGTPENMLWYAFVKQTQGSRVATRHSVLGLSNQRIGLPEIERILGPCPESVPQNSAIRARIGNSVKTINRARSDISDEPIQLERARSEKAA